MSTTTIQHAGRQSLLGTHRGKLTLALLCAIAFLDFVDGPITTVALPSIRRALGFSVQDLQWVTSGYLLTYGGFMLLGGRAADLLGRRRVLIAGILLIGVSSLAGGLSHSSGMLIGARLAQGLGAALTLPAALSILTTTFREGADRTTALGAWGGVAGVGSAAGLLLGGLLTEGPGWRWVMFVNPVACLLVLGPVLSLIPDDRRRARRHNFDFLGAALATGGTLLLVYALVEAPNVGWGKPQTIAKLAVALALLGSFVVNELRAKNPLAPLSIFKINGLGFANLTQLLAFAGVIELFFFLTLYMQNILGYSPIHAGVAWLPVSLTIGISASVAPRLIARTGTRPVIAVSAVITAGGLFWLSHIPVHGTYLVDLLPGMVVLSLGAGAVFVSVVTAANAGVPSDKAGLAASLLSACQQVGAALGLAIFSALATGRTHHLLAAHAPVAHALTSGFQRALLGGSMFLLAAAIIALKATNTRDETPQADPETLPAPGRS